MAFGALVVAYLFLGGSGAGLAFAACALDMFMLAAEPALPSYRPLRVRFLLISLLVASGLLLPGVLCLLADLGRPERALEVIASGKFSFAGMGVAALVACCFLIAVQIMVLVQRRVRIAMQVIVPLHVLTLFACLVAMAYTGLLLGDMNGIAFWRSPLLPVLFTLSSLSCGCALLMVLACGTRFASYVAKSPFMHVLMRADVVCICAELLVLAALLFTQAQDAAGCGAAESVCRLLAGDLAPAFWALFVIAGLLLPLAAEGYILAKGKRPALWDVRLALVVGAGVLVGGCVLRYAIVAAGAHPFLGTGTALSLVGLTL